MSAKELFVTSGSSEFNGYFGNELYYSYPTQNLVLNT